jgi:hypothetical protein
MSTLYNILLKQINNVLRFIPIGNQLDNYGFPIKGTLSDWAHTLAQIIAAVLMLVLAFFFGEILFNRGLVAIMPNVLAPIGQSVAPVQFRNHLLQLFVTLLAFNMIL